MGTIQTKKQSFIEANINTFVGFLVSLVLAYYILPLWGFKQGIVASLEVTIIYTLVSIVRNYMIRRYFALKSAL
ncbi:MAG: hypothetical protein QM497_04865 [Sulfurimonas sp.]